MRGIDMALTKKMRICRQFTAWSRNLRHLRKGRSRRSPASDSMVRSLERVGGADVGEGQQGDVRGMLFSAQSAVRFALGRAVRDVPPGLARRPTPAAATALRVPRAAYAGGLRAPHGGGGGDATLLRRGRTRREPLDPGRVGQPVG